MSELVSTTMPSPAGVLTLTASTRGLREVRFGKHTQSQGGHPVLKAAQRQLEQYFAGKRRAFDLDLDWQGTPFQQQVWDALLAIPYGETRSYGDIARAIGRDLACRAVGGANGANPIPIIVPCHRVIGSSGALTGYSGRGGLATKTLLLDLEKSHCV